MNMWLVVSAGLAAMGVLFMAAETVSFLRVTGEYLTERTLELRRQRERRELREATREDIAV